MTQYLIRGDKYFEHLQYALDHYEALELKITSNHHTDFIPFFRNLKNEHLKFIVDKDITMLLKDKTFQFHLTDNSQFKLEYCDEKAYRIFPHQADPNASNFNVFQSAFRALLGDEEYKLKTEMSVYFKGKILLIPDYDSEADTQFWQPKKID